MSKNGKSKSSDPEAEFLAEQTRLAKQAIGQVIGEIEHNLARSADVRAWAARYPWPTVAAATAAGFGAGIAASAVIHSKNGHSNGADNQERLQAEAGKVPSAAEPENQPEKRSGGIAGGLVGSPAAWPPQPAKPSSPPPASNWSPRSRNRATTNRRHESRNEPFLPSMTA